MSLLTDNPPRSVDICGAKVPINWDFRASIAFGEMIGKLDGAPDAEFIMETLRIYYPTLGTQSFDTDEAVTRAAWFFGCGKSDEEQKSRKARKSKQIISYEYDADYIYAAFMSQYRIDLSGGKLHWWKFRALLDGLKEDEHISQIMGYRSADASDFAKMSKEQKSFYRRMQKEYALPADVNPEEQALSDEINAALMSGGDISEILNREANNG